MFDQDVVISGIGSRFPKSGNLHEFGKHLLNNETLTGPTNRWKCDPRLGIKPECGEIPVEWFDDLFFGINAKLARQTDPVSKLGYERSFEAVMDAGYNPHALRGANFGVFSNSSINEFEQKVIFSKPREKGYSVMGMSRTMFANRISYYFDFTGPSCSIDGSWTAVHLALQMAADSIRQGQCDGALVVGANIARYPQTSWLFHSLGLVSDDATTRSFDEAGSGSVRSDSVVAFVVQRADTAKRCYAKILAANTGFVGPRTTLDITLPSPLGSERFLSDLYRSANIDPKRIAYLEADGSAHPLRDAFELNAIDSALVRGVGRKDALLVGSVKPNLGQVDCANGYAAVCKAIVAMETGVVPATLNYKTPNSMATGLVEGRIKVVAENTPLRLDDASVVAVNSMGLAGGLIGHTVLQANPRPKAEPQDPSRHLPRLIILSSRTEESAREAVAKLQNAPFDVNFYRLAQDVFSPNIRGYNYRTFAICPAADKNDVPPVVVAERRTLWFVFSGMGSQWAGMGSALMQLPVFAETIERLHAVLVKKGLDLKLILSETGPQAFNNILKAFVGITACQVALTNVLNAVGLVPDGIVGHSVGELGCAYADGCLTEEQAILAAWARGVASNKATLIKGMMAAVGLSHKDIQARLPPSIDVACHNSDSSCTLSGPAEDVQEFVNQLSAEGVFARAVNVSDIAYHSRYIQPAAPYLREYLKEVIPHPKRRSAKWVTTSVPLHLRNTEEAHLCSADYQTNNLLSPVLFEEALSAIPQQSLLVEVAPHGLLQAILKRALPEPLHVPLTQRDHPTPIHFLLSAIGKCSFGRAEPNVAALYPDVTFPVPRGTPSLAQFTSWLHNDLTLNDMFSELLEDLSPTLELSMDSPCLKIREKRLCPLSEQMMLAWTSISLVKKETLSTCPVRFENLKVRHWCPLPSDGVDMLQAVCMPALSEVVVHLLSRGDDMPVEYMRSDVINLEAEATPALPALGKQETVTINKEELYQELAAGGLAYSVKYQVIEAIDMGERDWLINVKHGGNWSCLLEAAIQVFLLKYLEERQEQVGLPRKIQRFDVDPLKIGKETEISLRLNLETGVLVGEGIYVMNVSIIAPEAALPEEAAAPAPTAIQFVPFGETNFETVDEFLRLTVHAALDEGKPDAKLTLMELPNGKKTSELSHALVSAIKAVTGVKATVVSLTPEGTQPPGFKGRVPLLVTGPATLMEGACALAVGMTGMLLVWSHERFPRSPQAEMVVLAEQRLRGDWLSLVRRTAPLAEDGAVVVEVPAKSPPPSDLAVGAGKTAVLVWRGIPLEAVEAIVAAVDTRPYASRARLVFLVDASAPPFSLREPVYAEQLSRDSRVNVLVNGRWGCWRALPLPRPVNASLSASSLDGVRLQFLGVNPLDLELGPSKKSLSGHVDYVGTLENAAVTGHGQARRVMGVGQWLGDNQRPRLDTLLRWSVPGSWTAQQAATVPYVYALVYHSLQLKAEARAGESILVHEGTSALGQAAIRVATQLGCAPIFTTVASQKQRELLLKIFPQLEPSHVLTSGHGSFEYRLRMLTRGQGVRLVVNMLTDSELRASMRCLSYWGRLLHYKREDMLASRTIGSRDFLKSVSIYGFSGYDLFRASKSNRADVAQAVSHGLRTGVVQPIVGAKTHDLVDGVQDYAGCTKAVIEVDNASPSQKQQCDPNKCYIVAGSQAAECLLMASRLSLLGARYILASFTCTGSGSSALVRQRQRALRRLHGTHLHVHQVRAWDANTALQVVQSAAMLASIHTAIVIAKDDVLPTLPALLDGALVGEHAEAALVLVADRAQAACHLAGLAEKRRAQGRLTACLAAPLQEVADHLVHLLSPAPGNPAHVTVLPSAREVLDQEGPLTHLSATLPHAAGELAALGRKASSSPRLRVRELPTHGLHVAHAKENLPVFALPPLGVLDAESRDQLTALAVRLYSPVIVVETLGCLVSASPSIKDLAALVVEAVLRCRPYGPYNVLGWRLSTVLALEVQRQLEAAGKIGVAMLIHGDVGLVRQWAADRTPERRVQEALTSKQTSPKPDDGEVWSGTRALCNLLASIAAHESDVSSPFRGRVHVIYFSVDDNQSLNLNDPHVFARTDASPSLDSAKLALYLNGNAAYSQLAGTADLRLAADSTCYPQLRTL